MYKLLDNWVNREIYKQVIHKNILKYTKRDKNL